MLSSIIIYDSPVFVKAFAGILSVITKKFTNLIPCRIFPDLGKKKRREAALPGAYAVENKQKIEKLTKDR
jgi:hypothetical protein